MCACHTQTPKPGGFSDWRHLQPPLGPSCCQTVSSSSAPSSFFYDPPRLLSPIYFKGSACLQTPHTWENPCSPENSAHQALSPSQPSLPTSSHTLASLPPAAEGKVAFLFRANPSIRTIGNVLKLPFKTPLPSPSSESAAQLRELSFSFINIILESSTLPGMGEMSSKHLLNQCFLSLGAVPKLLKIV